MIRRMSERMTDRYIPGVFGTRRFPLFISNRGLTQLKEDAEYQRQAQYFPEYNSLFPGYVINVDDAVICVDIGMPTTTGGAGGAVTVYQAIMMGAAAYGYGVAEAARVLRDPNDDGGRDNRFGWSAYEALGVLDDRFFELGYHD